MEEVNTIANDVNAVNRNTTESVYDTSAMANALNTQNTNTLSNNTQSALSSNVSNTTNPVTTGNTVNTTATTTTVPTTTTTSTNLTAELNPVYTSQDYYNDVINQNNENYIEQMYKNLIDSQTAQIDAQHQVSLNDAEAQKEAIQKDYRDASQSTAVEYERQRQALNEQANLNGLNTGAGSQMQLAMQNQYQASRAALESAKIEAQAELERQVANLNAQYQADIATAIAENNYQKAAALLDEKNRKQEQLQTYYQMAINEAENQWNRNYQISAFNYQQEQDAIANQLKQEQWQAEQEQLAYSRKETQAQLMASQTGDFTALGALYGWSDADIEAAKQSWINQNPEQAYAAGTITYDEYKKVKDKLSGKNTENSSSGNRSYADYQNSWYGRMVKQFNDDGRLGTLSDYMATHTLR